MKTYILDLDGVIYRGSETITGSVDAVNRLLDSTKVVFLTNNSTQSRDAVAAKLNASGIRCAESNVITAGYTAAVYIRKRYGISRIYPIGEAGLIQELEAQGHLIGEDANFVVAGLDRNFNYEKLRIGLQNIMNGAEFIATNTDPVLPTEHGFLPGAGAIVRALETASGRLPLVMGKPNPPMMDIVLGHPGVNAEECVLIGDRLDTDILAGIRYDMETVLVLSGVETEESLRRSDIKPDEVIGSIGEIFEV